MAHSTHHSSSRSTRRPHRHRERDASGPFVGLAALVALIVAGLFYLFSLAN